MTSFEKKVEKEKLLFLFSEGFVFEMKVEKWKMYLSVVEFRILYHGRIFIRGVISAKNTEIFI